MHNGCLTSVWAKVNKHRLFGSLLGLSYFGISCLKNVNITKKQLLYSRSSKTEMQKLEEKVLKSLNDGNNTKGRKNTSTSSKPGLPKISKKSKANNNPNGGKIENAAVSKKKKPGGKKSKQSSKKASLSSSNKAGNNEIPKASVENTDGKTNPTFSIDSAGENQNETQLEDESQTKPVPANKKPEPISVDNFKSVDQDVVPSVEQPKPKPKHSLKVPSPLDLSNLPPPGPSDALSPKRKLGGHLTPISPHYDIDEDALPFTYSRAGIYLFSFLKVNSAL